MILYRKGSRRPNVWGEFFGSFFARTKNERLRELTIPTKTSPSQYHTDYNQPEIRD